MDFRRLLITDIGRIIISIILGLGLATLFRKVCTDKNCIIFNGPIISDFENKIFKHGEKCYKFDLQSDSCDKTKKIVPILSSEQS
jgi:hypothetical protein